MAATPSPLQIAPPQAASPAALRRKPAPRPAGGPGLAQMRRFFADLPPRARRHREMTL